MIFWSLFLSFVKSGLLVEWDLQVGGLQEGPLGWTLGISGACWVSLGGSLGVLPGPFGRAEPAARGAEVPAAALGVGLFPGWRSNRHPP